MKAITSLWNLLKSYWNKIVNINFASRIGPYVAVYIILKFTLGSYHLSEFLYILLSSAPLLIEFSQDFKPKFVATLFVRKVFVCGIIGIASIVTSLFFFIKYTYPAIDGILTSIHKGEVSTELELRLVSRYLIEGILLGVICRKLLSHYFAVIIMARKITSTRIAFLGFYISIILLFPYVHKEYSSIYILGMGLGFSLHFILKRDEWRRAIDMKLQKHMNSKLKRYNYIQRKLNLDQLKESHKKAIGFYFDEDWDKLKDLITNETQDQIFFFLEVSMYRRLYQFDTVKDLLKDKIELFESKEWKQQPHPNWYESHEHYFYLHWALNENEIEDNGNQVIKYLDHTLHLRPNCILANALKALVLITDLAPEQNDVIAESSKNQALASIRKALELYEHDNSHDVVTWITGMSLPFIQAFLLDTYAYVLYKSSSFKQAKALLLHCQSQAPTYSPVYMHLGELYKHKKYDQTYIRSAISNCYISLMMEKRSGGSNNSFVYRKSEELILDLEDKID